MYQISPLSVTREILAFVKKAEPVDKVDRLSRTCKHVLEGLQPAASHSLCSHACGLSSVFSDAHVAGKNRFHFLPSSADDGTLRGSCTRSDAFALFRQAEAPGCRVAAGRLSARLVFRAGTKPGRVRLQIHDDAGIEDVVGVKGALDVAHDLQHMGGSRGPAFLKKGLCRRNQPPFPRLLSFERPGRPAQWN